jgi:hypothetical protein
MIGVSYIHFVEFSSSNESDKILKYESNFGKVIYIIKSVTEVQH